MQNDHEYDTPHRHSDLGVDDEDEGELKHLPLPPEIRQRIYRYALQLPHCFKEPMYHYKTPTSRSRSLWPIKALTFHYPIEYGEPSPFDLSLLLVSKQTFLEAFHVFYRFNTIYFKNTEALLQFLQGIGYARRQELTDVGFDWVGNEAKSAFRLLRTCGNLRVRENCPTNTLQSNAYPGVEPLTRFIDRLYDSPRAAKP